MPAAGLQPATPDDTTVQPTPSSPEGGLAALTRELGALVFRERWERAQCCDRVVANGGIGWVLSGIVRKTVTQKWGQRRIVDLLLAGDVFGLPRDDRNHYSFEASTGGAVTARISRRDFDALATLRPALQQGIYEGACRTIVRLEDHILVQGRTTATQKVASYLFVLARRLAEQEGDVVMLPMSRYDIADHIGMAVETVSRAITTLCRQGVIALETPRYLRIRNARKLGDGIEWDVD